MTRYFALSFWVGAVLICSCNGQDKTTASQTTDDQPLEWADPLFEYEGQLCQHLRHLHEDRQGNIWMGTNVYGIMRYDGERLVYFDDEEGFDGGRVTGILEDEQGSLWFTAHGGLYRHDGKAITKFEEGLADNELFGLIEAQDGTYWMGSMAGVSQFDPREGDGQFTNLDLPNIAVPDTNTILGYERVSCLLQDRDGTFWFGTDGFGICQYNGNSFSHITTADGLPDNNIGSLFEDSNGHIWISTMYGGMSRYDGENFTNYLELGIVEGEEAGGIYEDGKGHLWFPVEHHGVYRYDGENFTNYTVDEHGLPSNGILCFLEDSKGRFWLGGWLGLFQFDGTGFARMTQDDLGYER